MLFRQEILIVLLVFIGLVARPLLSAADFYVATSGSDSNDGSISNPWLTIQHGINTVNPGDTVYVRGGSYSERLVFTKSGSSVGGYITLSSYTGENVILEGSGLTPPADSSAMILLENVSYIKVMGFVIQNYTTSNNSAVPMGVFISGHSAFVQLLNNEVRNIEQNTSSAQGDAHAIAVYGTDGNQSINNLLIQGNTIHSCKLGSSEALVLNGNVEQFTVTKNTVYSCNNIGIDLIGWEGTAASNDQARNGTVSENVVYDITSYGNPAYGNERSAAGIYVDGGKDIVIERNRVYNCDFGVEVASEHQNRATTNITVRDNLIYHNLVAGITFGGYDSNRGEAIGCVFEHNTLFENDTTNSSNGEVMIQKAHGNTIENNIIVASSQNILISNYFSGTDSYGNVFNYNLYYSPGGSSGASFVLQDQAYSSFSDYQDGTRLDENSSFQNPLFANDQSIPPDFQVRSNSPAINAGDPSFQADAADLDFAGNERVVGGRTDCGAYEYGAAPVTGYLLTVVNGTGSGRYSAGEQVAIQADSSKGEFTQWSGDVEYINDINAAGALVSMPAKDIRLTALFSDDSQTVYLCQGMVITLDASDIDSSLTELHKKPKVMAHWNNGDNHATMKVITKISAKTPVGSFDALWTKRVRLYEVGDYKGELISQRIQTQPIENIILDGLYVTLRDSKNNIDINEQKIGIDAVLVVPVISGITGNYSVFSDEFAVEGMYFGDKVPQIYAEVLVDGSSDSPRYRKCKVDTENSYVYLNSKGQRKSCMKIFSTDTIDQQVVGYSRVTAYFPKLKNNDSFTGYIILDNGQGLAVYDVNP